MQKILIVEDDRLIAELERDYLESSGFDICRELRKDKNLPIIMVTAKKTDVDKIRGLGLGADDYIIKPFSPAELVARVRAHIKIHERLLREANPQERKESCIEIRNLKIYPLSRKVFVGEEEVAMTNKEFELLLFFARNPNIVFSRDTLFDRIWGMDSMGDTATVIVHVKRLRDKLEKASPEGRQYIETVWGAGYRFRVD